jgi:hypothetical protein
MPSFNFNAATVEPMASRSYDPLPQGSYEMMVVKSDVKPTKAGNGHYLELEMHVFGGEHSGRRLWERLNVDNPNKDAENIAKAALAALCVAVNVPDMTETEQLHDKLFLAQVEIDRKDPTRNRIVGYESATAAAPAPAPRAAAPAARPAAPAAGKKPWEK